MKLIPMTNFVLEQISLIENDSFTTIENDALEDSKCLNVIEKYANFLMQTLELWMFVPCKLENGVWIVL